MADIYTILGKTKLKTQPERSTLKTGQAATFERLKKYLDHASDEGFPLARLGAMSSDQETVHRFQSRLNLLGATIVRTKQKGERSDPLLDEAMTQAGIDTSKQSSLGKIAVGPQFDEEDNNTLEHELMHKAILEHFKGKVGPGDEEVLLRSMTNTKEDQDWYKATFIKPGLNNPPTLAAAGRIMAPLRRELEKAAKEKIAAMRKR